MKNAELLDRIYRELKQTILSRQHPVTGLLPASTAVNNHGDYRDAWVRDNVYSIMCVWALSQAFKHQGNHSRCDYLEQSTIKLMRGLLQSMMRQSAKVEAFKYSLDNKDALHAKYDTPTGLAVVADDAWGHLQIDATSLYLLTLAQMTASGLRIICTAGEVDFIQNLVFYISSAYRTPDYGIWERGNKVNNGKTEINASSVGMAKAALQALDGFNLFGKHANPRGVIHVIPDSISLARNTLASLLPRESQSKETDSALLSIIGFPAFAVSNRELIQKTREAIETKLSGRYGYKRFLWDGHQSSLEVNNRNYYISSELISFSEIESEWPLFFTYLYISAVFEGNASKAKYFRKKIERLMVIKDGVGLIPELYYVPKHLVEAEKENPRSQERLPNENIPLVWAQSLFITGLLLEEELINHCDLDPLNLRNLSTATTKTSIALVVIAENKAIKEELIKNGVIAESLEDLKPLDILTADMVMDAYADVGRNSSLGLSGRPKRRIQILASSETYTINKKSYLSLSWLQNKRLDYRTGDIQWFTDSLITEIEYVRRHWLNSDVAVMAVYIDKEFSKTPDIGILYSELHKLQLRNRYDYVGHASASFAFRASHRNYFILPYTEIKSLRETHHKVDCNSIIEFSAADLAYCPDEFKEDITWLYQHRDAKNELELFKRLEQFITLFKESPCSTDDGKSFLFEKLTKTLFKNAQKNHHWLVARLCFAQFNQPLPDLPDSLTVLASRNLIITVDSQSLHQIKLDSSFHNIQYFESAKAYFDNDIERVLVQELLCALGALFRSFPSLFEGLHTLQLRNFLALCSMEAPDNSSEMTTLEWLGSHSPAIFYKKIAGILKSRRNIFKQDINHVVPFESKSNTGNAASSETSFDDAMNTDWLAWRSKRGLISHFDIGFLREIWQSLNQVDAMVFGINGKSHRLNCKEVRSSMTAGEENFGLLIDELTQNLSPTHYKSAVIEALYAFTQFAKRTPERYYKTTLVFKDILLDAAHRLRLDQKHPVGDNPDEEINFLLKQSPHLLNLYVSLVYEARCVS
ncbi:MAG: glycoside hydrolase family 15 protein [Cellvibrio sp.]